MLIHSQIQKAVDALHNGEIIAYPTEAVYGLGCDPKNIHGIKQLLKIKNRSASKGFILVAANWEQCESYVMPVELHILKKVLKTWPGPITWVFPAQQDVPYEVKGDHNTIAIRVSDHPVVQAICNHLDSPIISTSANINGQPPAKDFQTTRLLFGDQISTIIEGQVGTETKPTPIFDAITGNVIRE